MLTFNVERWTLNTKRILSIRCVVYGRRHWIQFVKRLNQNLNGSWSSGAKETLLSHIITRIVLSHVSKSMHPWCFKGIGLIWRRKCDEVPWFFWQVPRLSTLGRCLDGVSRILYTCALLRRKCLTLSCRVTSGNGVVRFGDISRNAASQVL